MSLTINRKRAERKCSTCGECGHNMWKCPHRGTRFSERLASAKKYNKICVEKLNRKRGNKHIQHRNKRATELAIDYLSSRAGIEVMVYSGKIPSDIGRHILEFIPKRQVLFCSNNNFSLLIKGDQEAEEEIWHSYHLQNKLYISFSA